MEKNNCNQTGHKYGLWQIKNEKEVSRTCTCEECNHIEIIPMTSDSLKQIKKQEEAKKLINSFLKVSNDDINIIGYINVILEDAINYIDTKNKLLVTTKLNEIISKNILNNENKIILQKIITSIKENNIELFYDNIEYFQIYNKEFLNYPPLESQPNLSK